MKYIISDVEYFSVWLQYMVGRSQLQNGSAERSTRVRGGGAVSPLFDDCDYAIMFVNKCGCPLHQTPLRWWLSEHTVTSCGDRVITYMWYPIIIQCWFETTSSSTPTCSTPFVWSHYPNRVEANVQWMNSKAPSCQVDILFADSCINEIKVRWHQRLSEKTAVKRTE